MINRKLFINGEWEASKDGKTFSVYNPATEELVAEVSYGSGNEAKKAIESAQIAFRRWSMMTGKERAQILSYFKMLVIRDKDKLVRELVIEQGKSIHEARNEIDYSVSFIEWFAEEAKRIYGEVVPSIKEGQRLFTLKQPIGVVAAITPWNFPIAMVIRKVMPALAAGCTVVLKPSEDTPLTAFSLAELLNEAGLPRGVFNVVCGNAKEIGEEFTSSEMVKLLSFTGSTPVGKFLMEKCSKTVKKVCLELGGNAPFIVFEDANIEKAVAGLYSSKLRNGGQSCICANRVFVHKDIVPKFIKALIAKFKEIKIGNGLNEENNLGSMVNKAAIERISTLIKDAKENGAEVLYSAENEFKKGCFINPTILLNKNLDSKIHTTEIFGPIVSITTFSDEEEVVKIANDTTYGLASYFYTEDRNRIFRVMESLEYGLVGVNDVVLSSEMASFGGVKESGIGREGGKHGILEFLEDKFIAIS